MNGFQGAGLVAVASVAALLAGCGDTHVTFVVAGSDAGGASASSSSGGHADAAAFAAPHAKFPVVPNNGALLTSPRLVTILASNDVPTDGTDTIASLGAFSLYLPESPVWSALSAEYDLGTMTAVPAIMGPAMTATSYTVDTLRSYVTDVMAANAALTPDGHTVYLVYLPGGATFADNPEATCGFRSAYATAAPAADGIAMVTRCTPAKGDTEIGQLTLAASQAVIGAVTDPSNQGYDLGAVGATPWNGSAWVAGGIRDLGLLCGGTRIFEMVSGSPPAGWELHRFWSNSAAAAGGDPCVPPNDEPYYTVAPAEPWYSGKAGGTVTIPLVGWSAAATSGWLLYSMSVAATNDPVALGGIGDGGVTAESTLGVGTAAPCAARIALNNGVSATLEVTLPASAKSGDYLVLRLESFRELPGVCLTPPSEDGYHLSVVGVYVP